MSLFNRIFLPVLIVLLIMPLATYAIFLAASNIYVRREAVEDIYQTLDEATELAMSYLENLKEGQEIDSAGQRSLLRDIRLLSRGLSGNTNIISLNMKLSITYPVVIGIQPETEEIARMFIETLNGEDNWLLKQNEPIEITVDSTKYVLCATELLPNASGRAKYIIVYSPLYEIGSMLSSAGYVVLMICCILALATLSLLFITYKGVTDQISRIAEYARVSGGGFIRRIETKSGVKEIDELISEMNAMANRVNLYDADQKAFFQNASHELRTPLMSIRGYAECIECGVFEDPKMAADIIVNESDKLERKLSSILDISNLDGSPEETRMTGSTIDALTEGALNQVRGQAIERNIVIEKVNRAPSEQNIVTDPRLFDMALGNVLSNAVRHAKSRVEIISDVCDETLEVIVRDDGYGFDKDDLPHIFERFYKGKNGISGLGLSIAKASVKKLKGSIEARNESGAVVTIRIPVI